MSQCGAGNEANTLITELTQDATFPIPNINLDGDDFKFPAGILDKMPTPLTIADVTTANVDGPGAFDTLMRGFKAHLQQEWDAGRITGDDYTKAYISLTEAAMNQGIAFILGKDSAYWQAVATAVQAYTGRVSLETAKAALAAQQYDAANQKANYALTKLKLSTEDIAYCIAQYNLTAMLPQQMANLIAQNSMLKEQTDAQRAQTLDTRVDGAPVTGVLGKQKELYSQQITSYQRDSELKVAKVFSDSWTVQKTIDEGLLPPNSFTNAEVEKVLVDLRTKADLGV